MVRYIVIALIITVIGVPSWQIGGILIEKKQLSYLLQEQANSIRRYNNETLVKQNLKEALQQLSLPTDFTFSVLDAKKVKIVYRYANAASVFGYTYWQTVENFEVLTDEAEMPGTNKASTGE